MDLGIDALTGAFEKVAKLPKSYRMAMLPIIVLLVCSVYVYFLYLPAKSTLEGIRDQQLQLQRKLSEVRTVAGNEAAVKEEIAISECRFSDSKLDVRIADSVLMEDSCQGSAASSGHELQWDLTTSGGGEPLLLLPRSFYERGFPKAKVLVPSAQVGGVVKTEGAGQNRTH